MKFRLSFGVFVLAISLMSGSNIKAANPQTLILIQGHGQTARALAIGGTPAKPNIVYFTGPSGRQISLRMSGGTPGYTHTFTDLTSGTVFSYFVPRGCTDLNQSISVKYNVGGTKINRTVKGNDGGASERALTLEVKKAFANLPKKFQNALKEFYLFCGNATPCLSFPAGAALHAISDSTPYTVQQWIDKKPADLKTYEDELNISE